MKCFEFICWVWKSMYFYNSKSDVNSVHCSELHHAPAIETHIETHLTSKQKVMVKLPLLSAVQKMLLSC